MRSKIAQRIIDETPEEVREQVREFCALVIEEAAKKVMAAHRDTPKHILKREILSIKKELK